MSGFNEFVRYFQVDRSKVTCPQLFSCNFFCTCYERLYLFLTCCTDATFIQPLLQFYHCDMFVGGNSKTAMIAAISPADINYEETLSTLR